MEQISPPLFCFNPYPPKKVGSGEGILQLTLKKQQECIFGGLKWKEKIV